MLLIWIPVGFGCVYAAALLAFAAGEWISRRRTRRVLAGAAERPGPAPDVTVIVPARNEDRHIVACLDALLASEWPGDRLEVIVVDDFSEDATAERVRSVAARDGRVRLLRMADLEGRPDAPRDRGHKKQAVAAAVERSRSDIVLVTDADSLVPRGWVRLMAAHFEEDVGYVAGPVRYRLQADLRGGLLGRLMALEFAGLQGIVAGAIGLGRPILSAGPSVGYRRAAFDEVGGYQGLDSVSSGDDVLLMQRIAYDSSWRVAYCAAREAIVETDPPPDGRAFLRQRRRWTTNVPHHRPGFVLFNLAIFFYFLSLPVYAVGSVFFPGLALPLAVGAGIKLIADGVMLFQAGRFYRMLVNWPLHIPAQPLHVVYILWVSVSGQIGGLEWKDRRLGA